ncbi:MAG: plasmid mobilization relaxosome protein MobC [gamma proteobacterium endosymbiont of Lamellibrachia anaximandri]|nr:plasmid mobilization relaxosome protein MobC [gamma proteobacterium endosymbiont of Lamellibrachia anaximandri]
MSNNHSGSKNKYPAPFSLRLSKEERKELKKLADGQPLGLYIRNVILRHRVKPSTEHKPYIQDEKLLAKLLGALGQSRIASNINQLAKAANSGSLPVNEEVLNSLKDAVLAIQWMRDTLIKGMGVKPHHGKNNENSHDP